MGEGKGGGRYQVVGTVREPHPGRARGAGYELGQPTRLMGDLGSRRCFSFGIIDNLLGANQSLDMGPMFYSKILIGIVYLEDVSLRIYFTSPVVGHRFTKIR